MNRLFTKIRQWAEDRNLIVGSTPQKQFTKFMGEFGELCEAISKNQIKLIKDGIGDCVVVLVIIASQLDYKNFGVNFHAELLAQNAKKMEKYSVENHICHIIYGIHPLSQMCMYFNNTAYYRNRLKNTLFFTLAGLNSICKIYKLDFDECVQFAYNEIKDRRGKMIDGVFVKEEDLK